MNLNQRRPTGTHLNPFNTMRKSDVVCVLNNNGFTIEQERTHKGEWNERRNIFVVKNGERRLLDVAFKGDRTDWNHLWHVVVREWGLEE